MTRLSLGVGFLIAVLAAVGITGAMNGGVDIWQIAGAMVGAGAAVFYLVRP